jgi:ElaB/YqjD/DUF883 family membrane-anchored ribosome-binding protein
MSLFSTKTRKAANCATASAAYATKYAGEDLRHAHEDAMSAARGFQRDVSSAAERTERRARRFADNVYSEIESNVDHVTDQIRSNPIRSLLILITTGFMIGSLFTKRTAR